MQDFKDPEIKKEEREQITQLGSDVTRSSKGNIYTLTIIGQVEGHQVAPETVKTTKYEHVLPLLAGIEESEDIDIHLMSEEELRELLDTGEIIQALHAAPLWKYFATK